MGTPPSAIYKQLFEQELDFINRRLLDESIPLEKKRALLERKKLIERLAGKEESNAE